MDFEIWSHNKQVFYLFKQMCNCWALNTEHRTHMLNLHFHHYYYHRSSPKSAGSKSKRINKQDKKSFDRLENWVFQFYFPIWKKKSEICWFNTSIRVRLNIEYLLNKTNHETVFILTKLKRNFMMKLMQSMII